MWLYSYYEWLSGDCATTQKKVGAGAGGGVLKQRVATPLPTQRHIRNTHKLTREKTRTERNGNEDVRNIEAKRRGYDNIKDMVF